MAIDREACCLCISHTENHFSFVANKLCSPMVYLWIYFLKLASGQQHGTMKSCEISSQTHHEGLQLRSFWGIFEGMPFLSWFSCLIDHDLFNIFSEIHNHPEWSWRQICGSLFNALIQYFSDAMTCEVIFYCWYLLESDVWLTSRFTSILSCLFSDLWSFLSTKRY